MAVTLTTVKGSDNYDGVAREAMKFDRQIWLNASNGLLMADKLDDWSVLRVPSTMFERWKTEGAIACLPDEFLMELALGLEPVVIDFGAHKPVPRALYQGMPLMLRQIAIAWGLDDPNERLTVFTRDGKGTYKCDAETSRRAARIDKAQEMRLKYWKQFVTGSEITCHLVSCATEHDGDKEEFKQKLEAIEEEPTEYAHGADLKDVQQQRGPMSDDSKSVQSIENDTGTDLEDDVADVILCGQCGRWNAHKHTCNAGGGTWHTDWTDFCSFAQPMGKPEYHIYLCANGDWHDVVDDYVYPDVISWSRDVLTVPTEVLRETDRSIWFDYEGTVK